jgi:LysM repeat protein
VIEEPTTSLEGGPSACPFVAFEDDRDHRSGSPDYRHRCFASPEPEPRAFPHQERYCLSPDFVRCPIFLEWARQEAAGVKAGGSAIATPAEVLAAVAADEAAPAFLAGGSRTAAAADARPGPGRAADASATLWSYDGEGKRSPSPSAPTPPSSLGEPIVAMARRGPSHPGWENPPRVESFPRLRSREDHRANQPLLFVSVGIALVFVALILFPIVTNRGGGSSATGSGANASGSGLVQSAEPSSTDSSGPAVTYFQYVVKPGDQMWAIAAQFHLALWELELANPQIADPNHIEVGTALNIPVPGTLTKPPATPTPTASAT